MVGNYGETIAEFFVKFRAQSKYSQADLGRLLGVTPQYICNVENGRNERPMSLIVALSDFLDEARKTHLYELLSESSWSRAKERVRGKRAAKKRERQKDYSKKHRRDD